MSGIALLVLQHLHFAAHVADVPGKPGNAEAVLHAAPDEIRDDFTGRISAKDNK